MKITLLVLVALLISCAPKKHTLSGEVFLTAKDGQSKKLAGVGIHIYKKSVAEERGVEFQSDAAYITSTNSDGKFSIQLPPDSYRVVARTGSRRTWDSNLQQPVDVPYTWNVPVTLRKDEAINLSHPE